MAPPAKPQPAALKPPAALAKTAAKPAIDRPAAAGAATQAGAPGAAAGCAAGRRRLHGRSLVLKAGVEVAGGDVSQVGDTINVRADDARIVILRGVADYAAREGKTQ